MLSVSTVTLSRWECDKAYPTWDHHPRIIDYLGCDVFKLIGVRDPYGNEPLDVAILTSEALTSFGGQIRERRLELKLTVKDFAEKLSVSERTLRDWENEKHRPVQKVRERIIQFLKD